MQKAIIKNLKIKSPNKTKDTIKILLDKQLELQKRLVNTNSFGKWDNISNIKKNTEKILYNILCINQELAEVIDWLPFKKWKHYTKDDYKKVKENMDQIKYEVIDALHFFLNVCLILGFDSKELLEKYLNKNLINHRRQDNRY